MFLKTLTLFVFLNFIPISSAISRAPAVEPFVEIEVNESKDTQDTKENKFAYYNFETNSINSQSGIDSSFVTAIIAITLIFSLPLLSWFIVMNKFKEKAREESASNIAILSKYKEEKEALRSTTMVEEDKKAS